ncbi:MAG: hypothetical protein K6T91_05690 [Firmicutes bacterium]|nr:hypothetical protein [Bacillota bacterium]
MDLLKNKRIVVLIIIAIVVLVIGGYYYAASNLPAGTDTEQVDISPTVSERGASSNQAQADQNPYGIPGCRCHSKKPGMVKMHDAIGGQNCSDCHKEGENLMSPDRAPTPPEEMQQRIKTDQKCTVCHLSDGTILSKSKADKVKISGAFFCPKCRKQVNIDEKTCRNCGGAISKSKAGWQCSTCGPLVDIDKIAQMSKEKPSNGICRTCHFDERELSFKHSRVEAYNKSLANVSGGLGNCLACHKSHNQCGGCHF